MSTGVFTTSKINIIQKNVAIVEEFDEDRKAEKSRAKYECEDVIVDHRIVVLLPDHVGQADEN